MLQEHFWIYIQELILAVLGDAGDQTLVSHRQGNVLSTELSLQPPKQAVLNPDI